MDKDFLGGIIKLIQKTGDKCIVLNESEPAYVIMRVKDYENLILSQSSVSGLTEEELLDKINREIAIWKSTQENEALDKFDLYFEPRVKEKVKKEDEKDEDKYYVEPL